MYAVRVNNHKVSMTAIRIIAGPAQRMAKLDTKPKILERLPLEVVLAPFLDIDVSVETMYMIRAKTNFGDVQWVILV
jgi:hypothetical protein